MLDAAADRRLPPRVTPPDRILGIWEAFRVAQRNILEFFPEAAYREPIVEGGRITGWKMVQSPDWVEHVLKTRADIYPRSAVARRVLSPTSGDNLFIVEGRDWRWRRRAMSPSFAPRNLAGLAHVMTASAESTCRRLAAQDGAVVDMHDEMVTATFEVIRDALLSGRETLDRREMGRAVERFIETAGRLSMLDIVNAPDWIPRPHRLWNGGARAMDRAVETIIAERKRRGPCDPPDMLDLLMAASDPETGRGMSDTDVRNDLIGFIVAGHETTALALSWAVWLCAFDPEVQARARDEAQAALGDRAATEADLPRLGYVGQVLDEAMRLYPPGGMLARSPIEEDEIAGRAVKPGETVMIPVYCMHRHRDLWDDPDAFDPDRFAPERAAGRHRFAFLPFGAGPRICIGASFARMEAQIILATLLARFRFSVPKGPWPRPEMLITLRPAGGARLRVHRL